MSTHRAIATVAVRAPLEIIEVPTIKPEGREVKVRVEWVASTPLDLHQSDGGLLCVYPQILGDGLAGTVGELGSEVRNLAVGDKVFGFSFEEKKKRGQQEYVTVLETAMSKLPKGFTLQQAVTVPGNLVTVFHAAQNDLKIDLPWPVSANPTPKDANRPILIWGGSSSVGQFALQVFRHWGYKNLIATASPSHHAYLKSLGTSQVFNYRDEDVSEQILSSCKKGAGDKPAVPYVLDCIGSKYGSLKYIAKIATKGTKVAVLLPVIVKDSTEEEAPEYAMDASKEAEWAEGVDVAGVRTHFYAENDFFREHLQPTIVPSLLADGIVKPNRQKIVEGATLLERGQKALDMLRRKEASAERLVWRVSDA